MTPWEKFEEANPKEEQAGWDWRVRVPMWTFNRMACTGYPDWDRIGTVPPFVMLELTDQDASRKMAVAADDWVGSLFYYRDWTSSGTPCLAAGEGYAAGFWFQRTADAMKFLAAYGGAGSWQPDYKAQRDAIRVRLGR